MKYLTSCLTSFLITLLTLSKAVAAQNDDPLRTILTVRPAGQNVELMCTLRQPSRENNETIGWIIKLSVVFGISFLSNGGVRGYSADLLSNNLIIKNITMNDNRNTTEYQCVIHIPMGHLGQEEIVERGDIIILHVAGVPGKVPNVTITNSTNGNVVNLTVTWGEPVNHLDPIIMYNVSCSGNAPCPQSYTTSNNQTRSHIFTGFTANSYYTFSVVAINFIGSGEAGVVMVGEITTTTIAPSVVSMSAAITDTITSMGEGMNSTTSSVDITTTSTMDMMITNTTILSGSSMTAINNISTSANSSATNTIIPTSMVDDIATVTSVEGVTATPTTSTANTTTTSSTSSTPAITNSTVSTPMNSTPTPTGTILANTKATTTTTPVNAPTSMPSSSDDQSSTIFPIIIIIIVVMIICCCCCMGILFCCCCEKRERQYPGEEFCVDPRCSFVTLVILGVMTCGISILLWYMYLKNQSDDEGQDKYRKITDVSIIVLGIYTCGTSALLWWLYKGLCSTREKYACDLEDKSAIPLSTSEVKSSKVPSVSNQLAGHNEEVNQFTIPSQTGTIQVPHNEEPVPKNEEPVPNNDEPVTSVINEMYEDRVIPDGYAVVDTEDVIARRNAAAAAKQDPVQHQTTANGEKYALPNKPPSTKQQGVKYVELERLPTSGRIHTTANDVVTPYAELC